MLQFIARLQRESEDNRRRIALFIALVITLVVFSVWMWFFLTTTLNPKMAEAPAAVASSTEAVASPFATISKAGADLVRTVTESFGRIRYESVPSPK